MKTAAALAVALACLLPVPAAQAQPAPAASAASAATPRAAQWLAEINRDIWLPFMASIAAGDDARMLAVRSRDYVRVQDDARFIMDHERYVDDTLRMMAAYRLRGVQLTLELRFEDRIVNGHSAYERGIVRVLLQAPGSEPRVHLSRFASVSRREAAGWRVLADVPAPAAGPPDQALFERARSADDVMSFVCFMDYPSKQRVCD